MSEFKPGEIVDITIKGARVHRVATEGHDADVTPILDCTITEADVRRYYMQFPADWPSVTVERVAPAEWPPRPGDLWRDRYDGLWFAVDVHDIEETDVPEIVMVHPFEDYRKSPDQCNQVGGPLTLVHREDEQDGDTCKCGFRAPELGPHPDCPTHTQDGGRSDG